MLSCTKRQTGGIEKPDLFRRQYALRTFLDFIVKKIDPDGEQHYINNSEHHNGPDYVGRGKSLRDSVAGLQQIVDNPWLPADFGCNPSKPIIVVERLSTGAERHAISYREMMLRTPPVTTS